MMIVIGSLIDFTLKKISTENQLPFDPSIFRLFRAARLVKLLRRSRSLRILLWTFVQSFKALPYVSMLISLLFFIYGIFGVQMFALIAIDSDEEPWKEINRNNHFRTYFAATQVLFRVATGENWPNIMLACRKEAKCDYSLHAVEDGKTHCGSDVTYFYFVSFVFLCSFLMLNLFIAVIMDSFAFLTEDSSILGPHHLDEFVNVWADYDPRASGRLNHTAIVGLLRQMYPPIGLGQQCPKIVAYKRLVQMNMTLYKDGTVDYTGTFFALVRTGLSILTENANLKSNDEALRKLLKKTWPKITKRTLDLIIPRTPRNSQHMTIGKIYTAKMIWENYKNMVHGKGPRRQHNAIISPALALDTKAKPGEDSSITTAPSMAYNFTPMLRRLSKSASRAMFARQQSNGNILNGKQNENGNGKPNTQKSGLNESVASRNGLGGIASLIAKNGLNGLGDSFSSTNTSLISRYTPRDKQQIALALRNGQSPYKLYGLKEDNLREEWC